MNVYQPVRGGSWLNQQWFARASLRDRLKPSSHCESFGFRWALVVWRRQ